MDLATGIVTDALTRCLWAVILSGGLYALHAVWGSVYPRRHPWE
jgi:hypothetical protein